MSSEKFCLRWNDFESNISFAFRELREDKDFFDVTLACDDEQISAHKVILSACSPFFRNVLRRNSHPNPLLYLKGVRFSDLQSVLNFMYNGEVNVAQEELNSFLAVAEELKVKGLTQNQAGGEEKRSKSPSGFKSAQRIVDREPTPLTKRPRPTPSAPVNSFAPDDEIQEVVPVKTEPRDPLPQPAPQPMTSFSPSQTSQNISHPNVSQTHAVAPMEDSMTHYDEQYDDYGQYEDQSYGVGIDSSMTAGEGNKGEDYTPERPEDLDQFIGRGEMGYTCEICAQFSHGSKSNVRNHVESKHFPNSFVYNCNICGKVCNSRQALQQHRSKKCAKKQKLF